MARQISDKVKAIQELVTRQPDITWAGGAAEALAKLGYTPEAESPNKLTGLLFGVTKSQFFKSKGKTKAKKVTKVTKVKAKTVKARKVESLPDVMAYLTQAGGLSAVKARIEMDQRMVSEFEVHAAAVTKVAS